MTALNVVVGITGGIAAYKAVSVVRALVLAGHDVHVVATENALRFVGRPTLEAISRNVVDGLGGSISIDSVGGRGTTVRVELPVPGRARDRQRGGA